MLNNKKNIFSLHKIIFSLLLLCFTSASLQANDNKQQIVLEVYPQWYSDEDYTIQGNVGIEKVFESNDWIKYYLKPSISYALDNRWALHGGLGAYYTDNENDNDNLEIRPFQGISHFHRYSEKWKLSTYLRVEERFQYDTDTWDKENTVRLRLRFRSDYKLNPLSVANTWHKYTFSIEGFKTYGQSDDIQDIQDTYDNETRLTFGLERSLKQEEKIRFELAWKYQSKPGDISGSSANTVYFKFQYYPRWGEKGFISNRFKDQEIDQ